MSRFILSTFFKIKLIIRHNDKYPARGIVLTVLNRLITPWISNENIKLVIKNKIKGLKLNKGVIAKKNRISPSPIALSIGFTNDLLLMEK